MSMHVLTRLHSVWRARGALGFGRFVLAKLYSRRRDLLFEAETAVKSVDGGVAGVGKLLCIGKENFSAAITPKMLQQIFTGEGADYLAGLARDDLLFVMVDGDGNCLHHSFVLFDTRTKRLLGEATATPLFAHCVTRADARGMRLYPRVLRHGLGFLGMKGHARAIVNCDPGNVASVAGIQRAGFRLLRSLDTRVLLSFIGWQEIRGQGGESTRRLFLG